MDFHDAGQSERWTGHSEFLVCMGNGERIYDHSIGRTVSYAEQYY